MGTWKERRKKKRGGWGGGREEIGEKNKQKTLKTISPQPYHTERGQIAWQGACHGAFFSGPRCPITTMAP